MKVVLATGIYPPEIGGPATYTAALARECVRKGNHVVVITYGSAQKHSDSWHVEWISKWGGPFVRWIRYALALRKHAKDADVVYTFSSVSAGVPLLLSGLKKPKRVLRLGGDFFWERYTARGGQLGLRAWYEAEPKEKGLMQRILSQFDHIVFSTDFQNEIYQDIYPLLPKTSVIENALEHSGALLAHKKHTPLRLLFMGRFVGFKNLFTLIEAMQAIPDATLTIIGAGPLEHRLKNHVRDFDLVGKVVFTEPVVGKAKQRIFREHDVLIIPSTTEISPNVALEARSEGMPVLLTEETGLSTNLSHGMMIAPLLTSDAIAAAVSDLQSRYETLASESAEILHSRSWELVCNDHQKLFSSLLCTYS